MMAGKHNGGHTHDGEEWSYHENKRTHEMVPCATHPCKLHGGSDVNATSLEEAYKKRMTVISDENNELHERIDGMTADTIQNNHNDNESISISSDMATEILDEYVQRVDDIGMVKSKIYNNDITEGDEVVRLPDNSYVRMDDIKSEFPDRTFDRLAITLNEYDSDADIAEHWNDDEWLHKHAKDAMNRRLANGPDDITIGFSVVRMPSPQQWSDETGKPAWKYPARINGETDTDYYKRGARLLDETASKQSTDHTVEVMRMYPDDDGSTEAANAHRLANMLAWSESGCRTLAERRPELIWEHVDDDGIDHMNAVLRDDESSKSVSNAAWRTISASIEGDDDAPMCDVYDDDKDNAIIAKHDGRVLMIFNDKVKANGTSVYWTAFSSNVYDYGIDTTSETKTVKLDGHETILYPLKPSLGLYGEASSNGEPPTDRSALKHKLYDAMRTAYAKYDE